MTTSDNRVTVEPSVLTSTSANGDEFTVTISFATQPQGNSEEEVHARIIITPNFDSPVLRVPVIVRYTTRVIAVVSHLTAARRAGETSALSINREFDVVYGLVKPFISHLRIAQDETEFDPFDYLDPVTGGSMNVFIDVPEGALALVVKTTLSTARDVDLYLFDSFNNLLCQSTTSTARESCVVSNPVPSAYRAVVQVYLGAFGAPVSFGKGKGVPRS